MRLGHNDPWVWSFGVIDHNGSSNIADCKSSKAGRTLDSRSVLYYVIHHEA